MRASALVSLVAGVLQADPRGTLALAPHVELSAEDGGEGDIPPTLVVILPTVINLTDSCNTELDAVRNDTAALDAAILCEDEKNTTENCLHALQDSADPDLAWTRATQGVADSLHACAKITQECANAYAQNAVMELRISGLGISQACGEAMNGLPDVALDCEEGKYLQEMVEHLHVRELLEAVNAVATALTTCTNGALSAQCSAQIAPPTLRELLAGAAGERVRTVETDPQRAEQPSAGAGVGDATPAAGAGAGAGDSTLTAGAGAAGDSTLTAAGAASDGGALSAVRAQALLPRPKAGGGVLGWLRHAHQHPAGSGPAPPRSLDQAWALDRTWALRPVGRAPWVEEARAVSDRVLDAQLRKDTGLDDELADLAKAMRAQRDILVAGGKGGAH